MFIMISCRQASQLMSQQLDRPLKLSEKLRLHAHLLICKSCPKTMQQFEILHRASQQYLDRTARGQDKETTLSPDSKQRILRNLQEQQSKSHKD